MLGGTRSRSEGQAMSACEKCWADSKGDPDMYRIMVTERSCTPEQQAGPYADKCQKCNRWTRHQYTGECMACGMY